MTILVKERSTNYTCDSLHITRHIIILKYAGEGRKSLCKSSDKENMPTEHRYTENIMKTPVTMFTVLRWHKNTHEEGIKSSQRHLSEQNERVRSFLGDKHVTYSHVLLGKE